MLNSNLLRPRNLTLIKTILKNCNSKTYVPHFVVCKNVSTTTLRNVHPRRTRGPIAWFLLLVPVSSFALGTWQISRRKWKLELIAELGKRTVMNPVQLPEDISELEKMEYHPVTVTGTFDHSQEQYLGPRSPIVGGGVGNSSGLMSHDRKGVMGGYCVVTPFNVEGKNLKILINRGWVSAVRRSPSKRLEGQVEGEVTLTGFVRLDEKRPPLAPSHRPGIFYYRDLSQMAEAVGAAPVFLDADANSSVPDGPVGGQTNVTLRNEHLSYIFTWYALSAASAFMWIKKFVFWR